MGVYDAGGQRIGVVTRVYPVPEPYARGDARFGCFKVRRSRLPFGGPPALLIPLDAIRSANSDHLTLAVTRAAAAQWAQGRQSS